jgi:macrolide transport system ATP-binding/permease protein
MGWRRFFRRNYWERERSREIESYLEIETAENVVRGMPPEEAYYAARRKLGNGTRVREEIYRMNSIGFLETLWQDVRFALHMLRKSPGFTAVAIITLALGIGANTAIFSLLDAVMLRNLPVKDPQQLVQLTWVSKKWPKAVRFMSTNAGNIGSNKGGQTFAPSFSYPGFERFASANGVFATVFGFYGLSQMNVNVRGDARLAQGDMVTGDFFSGLGVRPILGRAITPADEKAGAPAVAVLGYNFWRKNFSGDPQALGKSITVNRVPFTIIGVAPPEFYGIQPGSVADIWVPVSQAVSLGAQPATSFTDRGYWWLAMMGRLRPGVTQKQARAALNLTLARESSYGLKPAPTADETPQIELSPAAKGLDSLRSQFSEPLHLLFAAVGLVLLIACANVAGLLMARAVSREREICVRLAVGAGRKRLVRQLFTESLLLALGGGAAGLLFAVWGSHALLVMASPPGQPIPLHVGISPLVLTFTLGLSIATAVFFGLAPALRATKVDLNSGLKENPGGGLAASRSRLAFRKTLVIAETALSMLLLVGGGLLVRTLVNLESQSLGFNPHHVLLFDLDPTEVGYKGKRLLAFYEELLGRIRTLPGVESASISTHSPLSFGGSNGWGLEAEGKSPKAHARTSVYFDNISTGFLSTMGIPLLAGRDFGVQDTATSPKVALINRTMARDFFGGTNPVGRWLSRGDKQPKITVVGVVGDTNYYSLAEPRPPVLYLLDAQQQLADLGGRGFEVRTQGDPRGFVAAIRAALAHMNRNIPLSNIRTQEDQMADSLSQQRLFARLSGFFAALALLLVSIGVYGLMAYAVTQRTHEIGIRMALGAEPGRVIRMVFKESLVLVLVGAAAGIGLALATTRLLRSLLFGLRPDDPGTIIISAAVMIVVASAATYLPARRAMRVDPMEALRYE